MGGCWYDYVEGRPVYKHMAVDRLAAAVALGEACADGEADLPELNRRSLAWRGKRGG